MAAEIVEKLYANGRFYKVGRDYYRQNRYVYEQAHGPIPDGCEILFADHDKTNLSLDNLVCVTRAQRLKLLNLHKRGLDYWDRESLEALLALVELESTAREKNPTKTANAIWHRQSADRCLAQMQANPNDKRHGTVTGYKYGCRCDKCRKAGSRNNAKRYVRRKQKEATNA